ncbi:MAG: 50S ribosomal protein L11 methyltransferase [Christensenella sp.]|nr:MAG: 50S ribosomal protein L11 methyltransferase [Christensenella sp.]
MKYKTITVFTNHNDADLISSAMFDAGAGGVSILDKQDFLDLIKSDVIWDYVDESVLMQSDEVKVSTICDVDDNEFLKKLETRLEEMKAYGVKYGEIVTGEIDAADYENEWKKYYKPIVTKHVTIVPTWIKYDKKDGERIMRLDPGMAFGTGSHATTRMCLELMDVDGKDVIDVGCGSGILGIAAKIAGAKSVYMCDIDEQAVEFARKNAELNDVEATIEKADLLEGDMTADFIFANITADILMRFSKSIGKHLRENGTIVLSGIIDGRLDEVIQCYESAGYEIVERMAIDDWRALKLKKKA